MRVLWTQLRPLAKDLAHIAIFVLGVFCVLFGTLTHDPAIYALAVTLFGLVGIARA